MVSSSLRGHTVLIDDDDDDDDEDDDDDDDDDDDNNASLTALESRRKSQLNLAHNAKVKNTLM